MYNCYEKMYNKLCIIYYIPSNCSFDAKLLNSTCKRALKCLLILIIICILMNILTLVAICYNVSVKEPTLVNIFNNSMNHYIINESDKFIVDEIQFDLQCCGHSNYNDWFRIKWQVCL